MSRREFTKQTKRAAWERSAAMCEAVGEWYGLPRGQRCYRALVRGVEFDHVDLNANSRDNSLENCAAVCLPCHRHKTRTRDIPLAAKTLRQQDKAKGIKRTAQPMPGSRNSNWKKKMDGTIERRS